jgi:hypothetical protein
MSSSTLSTISIVVDAAPIYWHQRQISLLHLAESIHIFCNALRLDQNEANISCIAVRNGTQVDFIESTKDIIPNQTTTTATNPTAAIPVGLFKAMCWINKQIHNNLSSSSVAAALTMNKTSRIILITATSILPSQVIHVMNVAFAAQKSHIGIDVFDCQPTSINNGRDDTDLVQLCHLANGSYYRLRDSDLSATTTSSSNSNSSIPITQDITRILLKHFVAGDNQVRKLCNPIPRPTLDLRAVCSVHEHEYLDKGFVCSVCLSVFCDKCEENVRRTSAKCSACESDIRQIKTKR